MRLDNDTYGGNDPMKKQMNTPNRAFAPTADRASARPLWAVPLAVLAAVALVLAFLSAQPSA
jgi:hypothetical protein